MQQYLNKKENSDEGKAVQSAAGKSAVSLLDNRPSPVVQRKPNNTGLPDQLKSGIENLSGYSLDDVKVHYNSAKPAQLNAHAYAQGTDIHVASGQEKHLPHEAWHVVQQKQGRVQATRQLKTNVSINDDKGLEKEADVMGQMALKKNSHTGGRALNEQATGGGVVQRAIEMLIHEDDDNPLPASEMAKLTEVKKHMDVALAHVHSDLSRLFVNVMPMRGTNPADTRRISDMSIRVQIADWFLRISSVGDICGMLSHEIGVHTLANDQMAGYQKDEETAQTAHPFQVRVGLHTHNVGGWTDDTGGRQRDHVNVARDKGVGGRPLRNVADEDSINYRALQYAATTLRIGDAIYADATIPMKERYQRLYDLMNSFLFDYARIIVTDDRGMRTWDKAPLVAQVYNWYKNVIVKRYGHNHDWLQQPQMQPTASGWGLRAYLLSKVSQALAVQAKSLYPAALTPAPGSRIARWGGAAAGGLGMLGSMGYSMVSGMGSVASVLTPDIVKAGVSKAGSIAGSVLRGADYLYGEAENLVLPNAISAAGWLLGKGKQLLQRR